MRQQEQILSDTPPTLNAFDSFIRSFNRSLNAQNRAPRTVSNYLEAVNQFKDFVAASGMPPSPDDIRREHIEDFIIHLQKRGLTSATVNNRFRSLQAFYKWMVEYGEIKPESNPMARIKAPQVAETLPEVLTMKDLSTLVKHCEKAEDGYARRDTALIRMFIDTGARLSEVANITEQDVDLDAGLVTVVGKGNRTRRISISTKTIQAMDRYMRRRTQKFGKTTDLLWLGRGGGQSFPDKRPEFGISGIRKMIQKRAADAGLGHIYPHQLRHTAAHFAKLEDDYKDGDIMAQFGWRSARSMDKYARSTSEERANAAHKRHSLGDRL